MNKSIRVALVEDEIPAARLLKSMLERLRPGWEIEVLPGNIEEAAAWFAENPHPDLLFLDIELSDGDSFLLLEKAMPQSIIIFTTAFNEYAIQAFGVNSIDYLLKPIREERLLLAIEKFEKLSPPAVSQTSLSEDLRQIIDVFRSSGKRYRTRFLINGADNFRTLSVDQIAYFYSENKVTFAVTRTGQEQVVDFSLDKLSEQLDPDQFFRANRQTIIGIDSIAKIEPYFNSKVVVILHPPAKNQILISKEKVSAFKMWLNY